MEQKLRTLGQERAKFALDKIIQYKSDYEEVNKTKIKKEIQNFIIGAPSVILQNGLGQALAFWASKCDEKKKLDRYIFILDAISEWLDKIGLCNLNEADRENSIYKKLILYISNNLSQKDYLLAQKETISMLEWMKRYANAFWEVE